MKKLVLMMVIGLGAAFAAQADLLMYFSVNAFDWSGPKLFTYASVGVAKDGVLDWNDGEKVYLLIATPEGGTTESDILLPYDRSPETGKGYHATGYADLTDYTANEYTFYVETYEYYESTEPIWGYSKDTAKSYEQLVQGNHIYDTGSTGPKDPTPWNVPEPTSGMLLLLGSALLALKRPASRKRCAATSKRA